MKFIICTLLTTLFVATGFAQDNPDKTSSTTLVSVGQVAPDFTVTMFDGSTVRLSELKGKVVLLNFWATWCPPCRAELKRVQSDIVDHFKGQEFVFLPISRGETRSMVEKFRVDNNYTFAMGLDPDKSIFAKYATTSIPRNFVIGKDGKIVEIEIGYSASKFDLMIKEIEKLINTK